MINTQVIAMHFPNTAVHRPISTADTREALKSPVAGDEAFIHRKRTPPDEFVQATPTVSTAEPREDHYSLQQYLTFLETQREQMEIYAKEN
jgi:hypothetical protein